MLAMVIMPVNILHKVLKPSPFLIQYHISAGPGGNNLCNYFGLYW